MRYRTSLFAGTFALLFILGPSAPAAVITWDNTAEPITDESVIISPDRVVQALNFQDSNRSPLTVTTGGTDVVFEPNNDLGRRADQEGIWEGTTSDPDFETIMDELGYEGNDTDDSFTFTFSNLTAGQQYRLQLFYSQANQSGRFATFTAGNTSPNVDGDTDDDGNTDGPTEVGEYAVGTFTADGTTQDVVFGVGGNLGAPASNAAVLATVPEPMSLTLLAPAGLIVLRRRR